MTHSAAASIDLSIVADDMKQVDAVIGRRLASDVALVGDVARYIIHAGGKRLRPVLLLLTAGALGCTSTQRFALAAVVEFIHTATLLHDDVVDDSALRRGRNTANLAFGNPASVLVGDFLYSRTFQMMVSTGNLRVMKILADATNVIAEGEVLQLMNMHDTTLDETGYLRVIRAKTAKLFEASAQLGAVIADAPADIQDACARYGAALGTAFQIVDDVLDYTGDPSVMGKSLGDDLREGKVTLPLIFAMQRANDDDAAHIRTAIADGTGDLAQISKIVQDTQALDSARAMAMEQAQAAVDAAALLPSNAYSNALVKLADQLLQRRS